jgi:hypothetical protein
MQSDEAAAVVLKADWLNEIGSHRMSLLKAVDDYLANLRFDKDRLSTQQLALESLCKGHLL